MRAQLSPARIDSILATVNRIKLGQAITVKHFQRAVGLMAAVSNVIPFGLLHEGPEVVIENQGVSQSGNLFRMIRVTRRSLRSLSMWKKAWFLSQDPVLEASCHRKAASTDASLTGWGAVIDVRALRSLRQDLRGHHADNVSGVSFLIHQGVLRSHPLSRLAHQILLRSQGKLISQSNARPRDQNQKADILLRQGLRPGEWRLHTELVKSIYERFGPVEVDLFASQVTSLFPLWVSLIYPAHSRGYACMLFPSAPGSSGEGSPRWDQSTSSCPYWPARVWFSGIIALLAGQPWQIPLRSLGSQLPSWLQCWSSSKLLQLLLAGLTPSTLKVYVAAIAAFHAPLGDGPMGRHQLVVHFLRGALKMRPAARARVPTWDLAVVLEGLVETPFKPLESAEAKNLPSR
ncbi:uncharacterized protein LOC143714653 [Siphateles boraxobius]|uniref:uncharacterized protein LOC143714653 n=1 Tax=Siphateles boraxobius TaxID=180520 RepID=UPI004063EB55